MSAEREKGKPQVSHHKRLGAQQATTYLQKSFASPKVSILSNAVNVLSCNDQVQIHYYLQHNDTCMCLYSYYSMAVGS